MNRAQLVTFAAFGTIMLSASPSLAEGSANRGQRLYDACAACHSLQPNKNMTGPSLADLWNRQAGHLPSFSRYSSALKDSAIIWDDETLDAWLANPQRFIPGNTMTFRGISDAAPRADLLAFLKQATQAGTLAQSMPPRGQMGGIMGGGPVPKLKNLDPSDRVQSVRYCADTYEVTTADGKRHIFWERNLRFKTDSSDEGPTKGAPALVGAGMMGDRADVIFAEPSEISTAIASKC